MTLDWPNTSEAFDKMAGRASASASNISSKHRSARRIRSSIRIRFWFCSTLVCRKRMAAQTTLWNFRRFRKWMMIGTATAPRPKSRMGFRKAMRGESSKVQVPPREPPERGKSSKEAPNSNLQILNFGLRRRSKVETALWIRLQVSPFGIQSGVAASLCQRTPKCPLL